MSVIQEKGEQNQRKCTKYKVCIVRILCFIHAQSAYFVFFNMRIYVVVDLQTNLFFWEKVYMRKFHIKNCEGVFILCMDLGRDRFLMSKRPFFGLFSTAGLIQRE